MAGQTIQVSVLADTGRFRSAMRGLGDTTGLNRLRAGFRAIGRAVAVATAAVVAGAVVIGKKLIEAGERAATSNARIEQIAESMGLFGDQAGQVSQRLQQLANTTARATGVDQNQIKATQAKLLTFRELAATADQVGGTFDRATAAAVDLAAAGFGTAETNAVQLGKALNDPITGITALNRVGVTFTQAQRDQIRAMQESGDMAGAQEIILQALETQVGGTAEATANASDRMRVAWSQVQENLGQRLLPVFERVSAWVVDVLMPAVEGLASDLAQRLTPAVRTVAAWVGDELVPRLRDAATWVGDNLVPRLRSMGEWITGTGVPALRSFAQWVIENKDWLAALAITIGTLVTGIAAYVRIMAIWRAATAAAAAIQVVFNAVMAANPIGLIVIAIAALVAGLVYFFTQTETGKAIIENVWGAIQTAIEAVTTWWTETALPAITGVWDAIVGAFQAGKEGIETFLTQAWEVIKTIWSYTPIGLITGNWNRIIGFFRSIPTTIRNLFSAAISWLRQAGTNIMTGLRNGITTAWNNVVSFVRGIPGNIVRTIGNLGRTLYGAGRDMIQGLINGAGSLLSNIGNFFLNRLPSWIVGPFKRALGIASPSRVFFQLGQDTLKGAELAFQRTAGLRRAVASAAGVVTDAFTPELALNPAVVGAGGRTGGPVHITVHAMQDGPEIGRRVHQALQDYYRINGRRPS